MDYRAEPEDPQPCRQCGAPLTPGATFCAECGASQRVQVPPGSRLPARPARPWWIPVAIGVGAIAAVAGGALLGLAVMGDRTAGGPTPTPSVASSADAASSVASASATSSASASPSASPTPPQAAVIPNRAIAAVAAGSLDLHASASSSAAVRTTLATNALVFVIGEPTDADDVRWYRVAILRAVDCTADCDLIGFVATPRDEAEEATLDEVDLACPSSPMADEDLAAMNPLESLHCYGRNDIVVEGTVEHPCCSPPGPFIYSPEWLANPNTAAYLIAVDAGLGNVGFRPHPDADLEVPERGDVVRATGHFEDPAATSCRVTVDEEAAPEGVTAPDPARVILDCRATFVWTDYEVIGHEDLGPCCGWDGSRAIGAAPATWQRRVG